MYGKRLPPDLSGISTSLPLRYLPTPSIFGRIPTLPMSDYLTDPSMMPRVK